MSAKRTSNAAAAGLLAAGLALCVGIAAGLGGCEQKERVFEMDTPGLDIEVNKTGEGTTEIEVETGDEAQDELKVP